MSLKKWLALIGTSLLITLVTMFVEDHNTSNYFIYMFQYGFPLNYVSKIVTFDVENPIYNYSFNFGFFFLDWIIWLIIFITANLLYAKGKSVVIKLDRSNPIKRNLYYILFFNFLVGILLYSSDIFSSSWHEIGHTLSAMIMTSMRPLYIHFNPAYMGTRTITFDPVQRVFFLSSGFLMQLLIAAICFIVLKKIDQKYTNDAKTYDNNTVKKIIYKLLIIGNLGDVSIRLLFPIRPRDDIVKILEILEGVGMDRILSTIVTVLIGLILLIIYIKISYKNEIHHNLVDFDDRRIIKCQSLLFAILFLIPFIYYRTAITLNYLLYIIIGLLVALVYSISYVILIKKAYLGISFPEIEIKRDTRIIIAKTVISIFLLTILVILGLFIRFDPFSIHFFNYS